MPATSCAGSVSAARSFVQIAKRSFTSNLDFLAPCRNSSVRFQRQSKRSSLRTSRAIVSRRQASPVLVNPFVGRSHFSTSSKRLATVCVRNALKDEDGKDMMLEITPRAAKRLSQIMAKDKNPNLALRIQVESGGCHGFQYLMSLVTLPGEEAQQSNAVVAEDDTIFQYQPDDASTTPALPKIILDEPSLELLKGSKVDFTMELIGSEFKIVDNPYASSSCGCGTSFDIKM